MKSQQKIKSKNKPEITFETHYLVRVLKSLYRESLDFPTNKITTVTSSFYNQSVEEMNEQNGEGDNLLKVFKFLKEQKYIKTFSEKVGVENIQEDETFDNNGNSLMPRIDDFIYYRKYECEFVPEKIIDYLRDISELPKYFIKRYEEKSKILLVINNKYILSSPTFYGPADALFKVIYKYPKQELTRLFIDEKMPRVDKLKRRVDGVLADLGFKKEIKKLFFLHTSKEAVYFRNEVLLSETEGNLNLKALEKQIKELRRYSGSHQNSMK